jgi:hypothetical protein
VVLNLTAINPVYETFQKHRHRLESEHRGRYALVSSNEIVGINDGAEEAAAELRARFSSGPMVVYCIGHTK